MKKDFSKILKYGNQATDTYQEWNSILRKMRTGAKTALSTGGKTTVKIIRKVGKVTKVVGVLTFVHSASTGNVSAVAEESTEDALWPFLDIARELTEPGADLYDATIEGGRLNRKRSAQACDDSLNNDVNRHSRPLRAGGHQVPRDITNKTALQKADEPKVPWHYPISGVYNWWVHGDPARFKRGSSD